MPRTFVYFSGKARTSGNFDDLMQAGRMDIVAHVIINAFFLSRKLRDDAVLHLVFYGQPDPPKHLEMHSGGNVPETGSEVGSLDISKKDVIGTVKKMLYKYRKGEKHEVFKGYYIEKKNLYDVLEELENEGKEIFILDEDGEDIRDIKTEDLKDAAFVLGDHDGFPDKELKRLKKNYRTVKVGNKVYFASQVVTIVNNELDRREL